MRVASIVLLGLLGAVTLPFLGVLAMPLDAGGDLVLVVSWPMGPSPVEVIEAAGARQVYPEAAPFGAFAVFETAEDLDRLRAAGAMTLLDGDVVLTICGGSRGP